MSAFEDAKRYLWLEGVTTSDDPVELLRRLVVQIERGNPLVAHDRTSRQQLEARVVELEAEVRKANERTRTVEHKNVQLEEQLKSDRLMKRVRELEGEVKKANERTRLVEHQLVRESKIQSR